MNDKLFSMIPLKRKDKYLSLINLIDFYEREREIYNTDYEDLKSYINRTHDDVMNLVKDDLRSRNALEGIPEEQQWLVILLSADFNLPKRIQKIEAINTTETNNLIENFLKPMAEIITRIQGLKLFIKKGRKPNPNAKPIYTPPASSNADLERVKETYNTLLSEWKPAQIDQIKKAYLEQVRIFNSFTDSHEDKEKKIYLIKSFGWLFSRNGVVSEFEDLIAAKSEETVREVQEVFISKNLSKVTSIVGEKGNLVGSDIFGISMNSGLLQGKIKFKFSDNSEFTVVNQVVTVWDTSKPFNRFPTTFRDIKLANGKVFKKESEEWMNSVFVSN